MATTPNMMLVIPDVGVTVGPDWANEINQALTDIDAHDHTSGNGAQIPTAGIAINADLPFNSFAGTDITFIGLEDQVTKPATVRSVYTKSGEMYYQDSAGNEVQITNAGAINVNAGELTYKLITTYPYNVLLTDTNNVLGIQTTASARTINLPAATNVMVVQIKDIQGNAQTNNITVSPDGSDVIDTAASDTIDTDFGSVWYISDGSSNWYRL